MAEKGNAILDKSTEFGALIVRFCRLMPRDASGFAVSSQLVRSGTSIGANVLEAQDAMSRTDFAKCMNIALKESRETEYWLKVVRASGLVAAERVQELAMGCSELTKILTSIVKTTRRSD